MSGENNPGQFTGRTRRVVRARTCHWHRSLITGLERVCLVSDPKELPRTRNTTTYDHVQPTNETAEKRNRFRTMQWRERLRPGEREGNNREERRPSHLDWQLFADHLRSPSCHVRFFFLGVELHSGRGVSPKQKKWPTPSVDKRYRCGEGSCTGPPRL